MVPSFFSLLSLFNDRLLLRKPRCRKFVDGHDPHRWILSLVMQIDCQG